MPQLRQKLLVLYAHSPDLKSPAVAWSVYDGTGADNRTTGDSEEPPYASVMAAMLDVRHDMDLPVQVPEGKSMREVAATLSRENWRQMAGDVVDEMSDAEMMDSIDYTLFPNFHPWGAFNRIVYRFRPNGDNPEECIHECWFMMPVPEGEECEGDDQRVKHILEEDMCCV